MKTAAEDGAGRRDGSMSSMAEIVGGRAWWFPIGSEDHVRVTDEVMSYEVDGELRLAESFGFSKIEFGTQDTQPEERPRG